MNAYTNIDALTQARGVRGRLNRAEVLVAEHKVHPVRGGKTTTPFSPPKAMFTSSMALVLAPMPSSGPNSTAGASTG